METQNTGYGKISPTLGIFAIQNVQVADQTFTSLRTSERDVVMQMMQGPLQYPLGAATLNPIPGDQLVAAYPGVGTDIGDRAVHVGFNANADSLPGLTNYIPVLGYHVFMRMNNFRVANDFALQMRYGNNAATGDVTELLSRNLVVSPTGDGNSTSEFIILNVLPAFRAGSPSNAAVNGTGVPFMNANIAEQKGVLSPIYHRTVYSQDTENAVLSSMLIFKGLNVGDLQSVGITVVPIIQTQKSISVLAAMTL